MLLDAAQSHSSSSRVTFAPVGSVEDGYTSAVIEVHDHSTGIVLDASIDDVSAADTSNSTDAKDSLDTLSSSDASAVKVQRLSYAPQKRKLFSLRVGMVGTLTLYHHT